MTTAPLDHTDVLVLDYLAALWAQSEELPPALRDELMSTVADYIAARRGASESAPAIITRLGPPEALVDAARRGRVPPHLRLPALVPPPGPAPRTPAGGAAEYTAVGLLTAGAFVLPVVSPVAGMLLATSSPHWTVAEKATGWLLTAGGGAAGVVLALFLAALPFHSGLALILIYLTMCAGSVVAGAQLMAALRLRGQAG